MSDWIDRAASAVSWPGDRWRAIAMPLSVGAAIAALRGPSEARTQMAAWAVLPIGHLAQRLIHRPRPLAAVIRRGVHYDRQSFPSTHAALYTSFFGYSAIALATGPHRWRSLAVLPAALVVLVGPARLRLGEHRPSDVAGGYVLGAAWLATVIGIASIGARDHRRAVRRAQLRDAGGDGGVSR